MMNVQELINQLSNIEDKTKMVYVHVGSEEIDILEIEDVDDSMDDRVDLNTKLY